MGNTERWLAGTMDIHRRLVVFCPPNNLSDVDILTIAGRKLNIHPRAFTLTNMGSSDQEFDAFDADKEIQHLYAIIGRNGSHQFVTARRDGDQVQEKIGPEWTLITT